MTGTLGVWQPFYYPKLHYLARLNEADTFVIFDTAEFSRQSRQHRARIEFGGRDWLTIPVERESDSVPVREATVDTSEYWWRKHRKTIKAKYGGDTPAPFAHHYESLSLHDDLTLGEFTIPILHQVIEAFDIDVQIELASEVDVEYEPGNASEYLARLATHFDCDTYYCGQSAYENYLQTEPFEERDVEVTLQDWDPEWPDGDVICLDVLYNMDDPNSYIQ